MDSSMDAQQAEDPADARQKTIRLIKIVNPNGSCVYARALLDTGCRRGNYISLRLVASMGQTSSIRGGVFPVTTTATNHTVFARGRIDLNWYWHPEGTRVYPTTFGVLESNDLDVVFGNELIMKEKFLIANTPAMLTLTMARPLTKEEKEEQKRLEQERRQQREALEKEREQKAKQEQQSRHRQGQQ